MGTVAQPLVKGANDCVQNTGEAFGYKDDSKPDKGWWTGKLKLPPGMKRPPAAVTEEVFNNIGQDGIYKMYQTAFAQAGGAARIVAFGPLGTLIGYTIRRHVRLLDPPLGDEVLLRQAEAAENVAQKNAKT